MCLHNHILCRCNLINIIIWRYIILLLEDQTSFISIALSTYCGLKVWPFCSARSIIITGLHIIMSVIKVSNYILKRNPLTIFHQRIHPIVICDMLRCYHPGYFSLRTRSIHLFTLWFNHFSELSFKLRAQIFLRQYEKATHCKTHTFELSRVASKLFHLRILSVMLRLQSYEIHVLLAGFFWPKTEVSYLLLSSWL